MAKSRLNDKLYGLLDSRGYKPDMYDSSGKKVAVPEEAELMQFSFIKDGEDYGKATVTVDGSHRLIIYYNDKIAQSPKAGSQDSQSWDQLMRHLRKFAINYQLGFERKDVDDLESDMAVRAHSKREGLAEGYHAMGKKQSYNDAIPETKIIIKHSKQMEEGEQRFRNVERIFIETSLGERILAPTTKPGIAQIYARHIAEGGQPRDDRWTHITEMCEEYSKMAGFVRATRNKQFNESAQSLINEGVNHYQKLRECLSKMRGKKGYNSYFESWKPTIAEESEDVSALGEMFKSSSLDPRIESVMPILGKLSKNISESGTMAEAIALEAWADSITDPDEVEEGQQWPDASNSLAKRSTVATDLKGAPSKAGRTSGMTVATRVDPSITSTKVQRKDSDRPIPSFLKKEVEEGEYKDPEEAEYDDEYQEMVKRVGEKAKAQEKAKQQKQQQQKPANEGLDANQKAVGQLGPTEKATNNNQGKLVGACESVDPALERMKKLSGL